MPSQPAKEMTFNNDAVSHSRKSYAELLKMRDAETGEQRREIQNAINNRLLQHPCGGRGYSGRFSFCE